MKQVKENTKDKSTIKNKTAKETNDNDNARLTDSLNSLTSKAAERAERSDSVYKEALKNISPNSNPLLSVADTSYRHGGNDDTDIAYLEQQRRKLSQAATINALGELASVIGGGIAAAWGGNPALPDKVSDRLEIERITATDDKIREAFDRQRKENLAEAIRRQKQSREDTQNYLDRLYQLKRDDAKSYETLMKETLKAETNRRKIEADAEESQLRYRTQNNKGKTTERVKTPAPITYIYDSKNNRIPIYREEATRLYEIADRLGMLDGYRAAKSSDERDEEFYAAIANAYRKREEIEAKIREKEKGSNRE